MADPPKTYQLPARELWAIRDLGMSLHDARTQHDGYFSSWIERARTVREGREVITLQERGQGWAVELTLDASGDVAEATPLAPEQARALDR